MSISKFVKITLSVIWIKYLASKVVGFSGGAGKILYDFGDKLYGKIKNSIVQGIGPLQLGSRDKIFPRKFLYCGL